MPKRLTTAEYHKKHSLVIDLAQKQHTLQEIAARSGKSPSHVSFLITTARQRGIEIPYKRKPKKVAVSQKATALDKIEKDITKMKIHPLALDKARRILNDTSNLSSFPLTLAREINLPYVKANQLAQLLINQRILQEH